MTLAGILRLSAAFEAIAAVALAVGLIWLGAPTWLAVLLGLVLPFAVHGVPLAIEFITGALIDRRPGCATGAARARPRLAARNLAVVRGLQHRPAVARRLPGTRDRA